MAEMSLPWWLGPHREPWEALVAGVQAGSAIASNRLRAQQIAAESAQAVSREALSTQLRLADMAMEKDRNDLALRTFQSKQDADKLRAEGMLGLGEMVSRHIKDNRLTDPEAQSEFHNYAARYGSVIPQEQYNSIWDNNYGAAMARKDRAAGRGAHSTTTERDWATLQELKKEADNAVSEEHRAVAKKSLDEFKQMKGIALDTSVGPKVETITRPDGTSDSLLITQGRFGPRYQLLPRVDTSKLSQVEKIVLEREAKAIDPKNIKYYKETPEGFVFDDARYEADLKALSEKYSKKPSAAAPASTATFEFDFNPTNRTLVPIK